MACEKPLVSIVVPTYNERENLPVLLERIEEALKGKNVCFEVIVVDDDSPDGTWRVAQELAARRYPWLRVVRRIGERGLGTAIVRGLREARGDYIIVMDADLQHPPETIPRLIEAAVKHGADVVVASRYSRGGGVEGWSKFRLLVSRVASLAAKLLLPEARLTSDPMSGFWLVKRSVVERAKPEGRSWKVLLEILVRAKPVRVVDVPYVFRERVHGRSKLGLRAIISYLLDLLRLSEYRVLKFLTVGASGTIVNIATLYALHELLSIPLPLAYLAAFETSLTWNYTLHDYWTFRGIRPRGPRNWLTYWLRYHKAAVASLVGYYATAMTLSLLGVWYILAAVTGIAVGFAANFLISQHHVWNPLATGPQRGPGSTSGQLPTGP